MALNYRLDYDNYNRGNNNREGQKWHGTEMTSGTKHPISTDAPAGNVTIALSHNCQPDY